MTREQYEIKELTENLKTIGSLNEIFNDKKPTVIQWVNTNRKPNIKGYLVFHKYMNWKVLEPQGEEPCECPHCGKYEKHLELIRLNKHIIACPEDYIVITGEIARIIPRDIYPCLKEYAGIKVEIC